MLGSNAMAQFGLDKIGDVIKGGENVKKVAKGVDGVSLEEELDMGGSLALEIASRKGGILKDATMTKRVAVIGKALTLYCTRPTLNFTFAILDNPEVNAISSPGGYVFVTKGLVDACKSDTQLAGVLAHEIAHVTRRHALKLVADKQRNQGLLGLGSMAAGGSDYGLIDGLVGKVVVTMIEDGLPAKDEFDADLYGSLLAYDTGFPPRTLRDYLQGLAKKKEGTFSTHPKTEERVEKLDEKLKEKGLVSGD
jgi:predicted Zn-dependent protease